MLSQALEAQLAQIQAKLDPVRAREDKENMMIEERLPPVAVIDMDELEETSEESEESVPQARPRERGHQRRDTRKRTCFAEAEPLTFSAVQEGETLPPMCPFQN
jgi:hypothetical protein